MIADVIFTAEETAYSWRWHWRSTNFPIGLKILGYAGAYLPVLVLAAMKRQKRSIPMFGAAVWVFLLAIMSSIKEVESSPWIYLWVALGCLRALLLGRTR